MSYVLGMRNARFWESGWYRASGLAVDAITDYKRENEADEAPAELVDWDRRVWARYKKAANRLRDHS